MTAAQQELYDSLSGLCVRLPVPGGSWHIYEAAITAARTDFERALVACVSHPAVFDLLAVALAGELDLAFDPDAAPQLTAAYERFGTLPIPRGRHPFLDEIVPTLEAIEATLLCLSLDQEAARAFPDESSPGGRH